MTLCPIVAVGVDVGSGLKFWVDNVMYARFSDHDIEHDWLFCAIQDDLCKSLESESLVDRDIFASAALNVARYVGVVSLFESREIC